MAAKEQAKDAVMKLEKINKMKRDSRRELEDAETRTKLIKKRKEIHD